MLAKQSAPPALNSLFDSLFDYLECGKPILEIPWEQIDQSSWSPFQAQVYQMAAQIPFGETRTYSWIAKKIGNPHASRAVGQSLRKNPLPILIPCHRIIGANDLGGFMGAQNESAPEIILKRRLIAIESDYLNPVFSFLYGAPTHRTLDRHSKADHRLDS